MKSREQRLIRSLTHAIGYVIEDVVDAVPNILVQEEEEQANRMFLTIVTHTDNINFLNKLKRRTTTMKKRIGRILATIAPEGVVDSLDTEPNPFY